jgi:hypothetical protein
MDIEEKIQELIINAETHSKLAADLTDRAVASLKRAQNPDEDSELNQKHYEVIVKYGGTTDYCRGKIDAYKECLNLLKSRA